MRIIAINRPIHIKETSIIIRGLNIEGSIEGEDLECASCGRTFNIVSGDSISDPEADPLKVYNVTEEDGNLFLNF